MRLRTLVRGEDTAVLILRLLVLLAVVVLVVVLLILVVFVFFGGRDASMKETSEFTVG